jgi:hypothetical protein
MNNFKKQQIADGLFYCISKNPDDDRKLFVEKDWVEWTVDEVRADGTKNRARVARTYSKLRPYINNYFAKGTK